MLITTKKEPVSAQVTLLYICLTLTLNDQEKLLNFSQHQG